MYLVDRYRAKLRYCDLNNNKIIPFFLTLCVSDGVMCVMCVHEQKRDHNRSNKTALYQGIYSSMLKYLCSIVPVICWCNKFRLSINISSDV